MGIFTSKISRAGLATAILCLLATVLWWTFLRRTYNYPNAIVTCAAGGDFGTDQYYRVRVFVRDRFGLPVSGLRVGTDTDSGMSFGKPTDSSGSALNHPGEAEIYGVEIGRNEFHFCRPSLPGVLFAPDCSDGLTITVDLRD